jgi:hypothetical protein
MSNRAHPTNWSIRHFPQKGALPFALILWGAYFLVVVGGAITTAIIDGDASRGDWKGLSAWDWAFPLMSIGGFVVGLLLIGVYLRLHVAHGQTRRRFMSRATVFVGVCSAALAALTTLGFELEIALYRANGGSHVEGAYRYMSGPDRFPGLYFTAWAEFAVWMVTGVLVTAGFRRFKLVGLLLTIPLAATMIVLTWDAMSPSNHHILGPSLDMQKSLIAPALASVALSLTACWALTRRVRV